jgi:hypothetical protein
MPRPTKLTRARHERIVELLRDGVPFAGACRAVGVSSSAGYEWLYRGWGTHPDRAPKPTYVRFAQAVDAVFPGGFAERHEDEFAAVTERSKDGQMASFVDVQSSVGTESGGDRENGGETVGGPGTSRHVQPQTPFAELAHMAQPKKDVSRPQNRSETGEAAGFSEFPESGEGFAEVAEPGKSDMQRDRARAREEDGDTEPRHAPMPWLSQRSRKRSILDIEF